MLSIDPLTHYDCFSLQIEVLDPDGLLSHGTSDHRRVGLDASLAHYASFIDKEIFMVFHNKHSDDASIPILALKALSKAILLF